MNAWDHARKLADKHGNAGGLFVRLASDGDRVTGVFCGEPRAREVVWTGERYEDYDPRNPEHQGEGKRPSLRVAINFYVIAEGAMKIIEGGTQWFKDVVRVRDKYGLDRWSFEIQRQGAAGDPKTRFSILPEVQIDESLRSRIAKSSLHDLDALQGKSRQEEARVETPAVPPESGSVIDAPTALNIVGRLRKLPRPVADSFLAELGAQRVRDIRQADLARAQELLGKCEADEMTPEPHEIDPFA